MDTTMKAGILVAEDLPDDVVLLKHAFAKAGVNAPLRFVADGQEAVEYLKGENRYADRASYPLPALLLLDLNMPRLNGFDVLKWVRGQTGLCRLPIIVFTSSEQPRDVNRAYELGANSYLVKPPVLGRLQQIAQHLGDYWLKVNLPPDIEPNGSCPDIRG
jgi:CheY-like chemotaxis protein